MATREQCESAFQSQCLTYDDYLRICFHQKPRLQIAVNRQDKNLALAIEQTIQNYFYEKRGDELSRALGLPTTDEQERTYAEGEHRFAAEANEISREANRISAEANEISRAAQRRSRWAIGISIAAGVGTLLSVLSQIFGIIDWIRGAK